MSLNPLGPRKTGMNKMNFKHSITGKKAAELPKPPCDSFTPGEAKPPNTKIGRLPVADRDMGEPATGGTYTGNVRIHRNFRSKILGNTRNVQVLLPPGYDPESPKKYPVLYMADGQNLFNSETAFGGCEWGVDETAIQMMKSGQMEKIIIVAVDNAGANRIDEYTHVTDPDHGGGGLNRYGLFLTDELKPFIDKNYNTTENPDKTGIMGSSLGGLSSIYLGWSSPSFGLVGALSPSIWWAGKDIVDRVDADPRKHGPAKIYIDMGTREGLDNQGNPTDEDKNGIPDTLDNSRAMGEVFLDKGYKLGSELFYHEEPGAGHNEWAWSRRINRPLGFLFPKDKK